MIVWDEEFPESYRVPREISDLVLAGTLEDMSWRLDASPSFGVKLKDKNWLRLWVEHVDPRARLGWKSRYTLVIQPDLVVPFGWKIVGTDDMYKALSYLTEAIRMRRSKCRFKIGN